MESGSKGGEGVSFRAWTSSNSSLDSTTGNLHITAARTKWKKRKRWMNLKWLSWTAILHENKSTVYIIYLHQRLLCFKQFSKHLTWGNMSKPNALYTNFLRAIHSLKIKQIWRPANEKTLNALLSRAGFESLSREMWLMFSTNSKEEVPRDLDKERKKELHFSK